MAGVKPLLETIGALLPRIKAWHSSPHDFDKFDLSKIGTGQGAASYGPGIYAAESPAVSGVGGEYWKEFARGMVNQEPSSSKKYALDVLADNHGNKDKAIEFLNYKIEQNPRSLDAKSAKEALWVLQNEHVGPRTYELNLKADPQSFLQWDEPLSKQPQIWDRIDPRVKGAIDEAMDARGVNAMSDAPEAYKGHELWRALQHHDVHESLPPVIGKSDWYKGDTDEARHSMEYLKSLDIPGIRYADAASRNPTAPKAYIDAYNAAQRRLMEVAQGKQNVTSAQLDHLVEDVKIAKQRMDREYDASPRTYNYVINNPDIIEIMRKLAIPGVVGGGGAASVYQPQGSQ